MYRCSTGRNLLVGLKIEKEGWTGSRNLLVGLKIEKEG